LRFWEGLVIKTKKLIDRYFPLFLLVPTGIENSERTFSPTNEELKFVPIQGIFLAVTGGFYAWLWDSQVIDGEFR
jgi:hypothetical protein